MDWTPSNLCECIGNDYLGIFTAILAAGIPAWYSVIAAKWWLAANEASPEGKRLWQWLVVIFVACSIAGYTTITLMLFMPKTAIILRIIALVALNIACPAFLMHADSRSFKTVGHHESIGNKLATADLDSMSDRELANFARALAIKSIKNLTGTLV